MVCKNHVDRQAVAQCVKCGAYICAECANKTAALRNEMGVLCPDCYNGVVESTYNYYVAQRKKKMTSAIVSLVFYILGIICCALAAVISPVMGLVGFLLMGIYPAISWCRFAGKSLDEYDAKHGATYVVTSTGIERDRGTWVKVAFFLLGIVFGVFVTPINIICWLVGAGKDKKQMKVCEENYIAA